MGSYDDYVENAEERLEAAEYLMKGGFYDDAVSRAYYCIYNAAKAALTERGKDAATHGGLISLFGQEFVKTGEMEREIGKAFSYVEEEREDADYEPLLDKSREQAEDSIRKARKFLEAVKDYGKGGRTGEEQD